MLPGATSTFLPSSSISTICLSHSGSGCVGLRRRCNLGFELGTEMFDHGTHRHSCRITQRTNRAPHDVQCHFIQQCQIFWTALAMVDTFHHTPQPASTFTAWRALPTRLVLIEIR